jgi:hypothetical protein
MSYVIHRTNTETGAAYADITDTEKDARRQIFWCALDNVGMSRRDATKAANAAPIGEPYAISGYLFTIEKVSL